MSADERELNPVAPVDEPPGVAIGASPLQPLGEAESEVEEIDLDDIADWEEEPQISFGDRATLQIARWVLSIFAGVYLLAFLMAFLMLRLEGVTYENASEMVKFFLGSILPLVTLAVGYYLGDRGNSSS